MIRSLARRWADTRLARDNQRLRDDLAIARAQRNWARNRLQQIQADARKEKT